MVSTRPSTSNSSSHFNNPFVTIPKAPITIGIIVTITFHSFLNSLARSRYLAFFSHFWRVFSHQRLLIVFHWSLSDRKSAHVSKNILNILADLNNSGWSPLVLLFLSFPVSLSILRGLFQVHQLQVVLPSHLCPIVCSLARCVYLSLISLYFNFTWHIIIIITVNTTIWMHHMDAD